VTPPALAINGEAPGKTIDTVRWMHVEIAFPDIVN
jgi:hypothetical protein